MARILFHARSYVSLCASQLELCRILTASSGRLTVVGDINQSIYGFQGASPEHNFGALQRAGVQPVWLSVNYRSSRTIALAAHALISRNCTVLTLPSSTHKSLNPSRHEHVNYGTRASVALQAGVAPPPVPTTKLAQGPLIDVLISESTTTEVTAVIALVQAEIANGIIPFKNITIALTRIPKFASTRSIKLRHTLNDTIWAK